MDFALPTPLPFDPPESSGPLSRYLPPLPAGAARAWLEQAYPGQPGTWLIDPFGSAPRLAVMAAQHGFRVLVAANNPVQRFLLEHFAQPPTDVLLRSVLAELAASHKGSQRIELHLRSLYQTYCDQCGAMAEAKSFLWERGAAAPYARVYHCNDCGASGEFPTTAYDLEQAARFSSGGLHFARALERVAPTGDPDREHAEEALAVYLPRAVYALFTMINKLDGLNLPPARRTLLEAMLLYTCDIGSSLWDVSGERDRPRQLSAPPRFFEYNLWQALEQAVDQFSSNTQSVPLVNWPALPPHSGGICLFEGPLRELKNQLHGHAKAPPFAAALAVLPRPNQAFWTLSALWAGWLWGRDAAAPFKSVLRRRRYDWAWHTTALESAFEHLAELLSPGSQFVALSAESEPGLLGAALIAAHASRFHLSGIALRGSHAHISWQLEARPTPAADLSQSQLSEAAARAGRQLLLELGQPTSYARLHAATLAGLAANNSLPATPDAAADNFNHSQAALREALTYRKGFRRFGAGEAIETGLYWLLDEGDAAEPLADRVEKYLVSLLLRSPATHLNILDRLVCEAFPGLLTPDHELVQACLDSYGFQDPPERELWMLRPEDTPAARRSDLETIHQQLIDLGVSLGFTCPDQTPVLWQDHNGIASYAFYPIASAVIGSLLSEPLPSRLTIPIIVLPGGRANLVAYKLRRNPRLEQQAQAWRFLKSRHLRVLLQNPALNAENLDELMAQDPLTFTAPQMRLL